MKTAIIGASGEIGARLTQAFLLEGKPVRAVSRKKSPRLARWGDIDFAELEIPASESELLKTLTRCDTVVNCVVDKKPFQSDEASIQSNEEGLRNLMEASIRSGVKKFIHLSTIAVLPPRLTQQGVDSPFSYSKENDWYSRVKIATEKIAFEYKDKIELCVIRPGIVYGPYMFWSRIAFHRIQNFKVVVPLVSNSVCHAIHVDDLVGLLQHLVKQEARLPVLLHGINPEPVTWKAYYELHANALGLYDEIISEMEEALIRAHFAAEKRAEEGPGAAEFALERLRRIYRRLPQALTQNPLSKRMVDVMKVIKRGLPFYARLYLPPPKDFLFPNEFELNLYSTTGRFKPEMTGGEQGYIYRISLAEGVKSAAAWWNFQVG
ncbi:MAG TPA: NAD(P)-dependent oxidoreductase [Chitinophagales bacterium]|nr:NAD(P)-dependent oxidoreductase [Chitinophagales bacterium]